MISLKLTVLLDLKRKEFLNVIFLIISAKGKVYKGSIVQAMKKNDDNIKLNEILVFIILYQRVIEEKNEIIIKQNLELQKLRKEDRFLSGEINVQNNSYNKNNNISEYEN